MRQTVIALFTVSILSICLSCKKEEVIEETVVVDEITQWHITLAANAKEMTWYDPYIIARNGHEMSALFHDQEQPGMTVMLYVNACERLQILLAATDNSVMVMPLNYTTDPDGNIGPAIVFDCNDKFMTLSSGYISGDNGAFIVTGSVPMENTQVQTKGNLDPWNRSIMDSFAEIYNDSFAGETMEKWANQQDFFTGLGTYTRYFLRFATAAGTVSLYENVDRDEQQNAADEYYEFVMKDMLWKIVLSPIQALPASNALSTMAQLFAEELCEAYGSQISKEKAESKTTEWTTMSRALSESMRQAQVLKTDNAIPFKVSVDISDIEETSAMIKGVAEYVPGVNTVDMTVIEKGFSVTSKTQSWTITSDDLTSVKLALEPSTLYTVRAYVKTLRGTWESSAKSFYTKGIKFVCSPGSFVFNYNGGKASTTVSAGDGVSWRVLKGPSWCTLQCTRSAIYLSVKQAKKDRSGEIIIEVQNHYGDKEKYSLSIAQEESSWDNTSWILKGVYYWDGSPRDVEEEVTFKTISTGYTEHGDGYTYDYFVNESGQAIMVYTEPHPYYPDLKMVETYYFTRTGADSAIATLSGYSENPGFNSVVIVKTSGEFTCTRKR